jgi:cobalt/nickel transport system permease protein
MNTIPAGILLHIPDGFLNLLVSLLCWAITVLALSMAVRHTSRTVDERLIPLAGILAAFIFAAQMLNFPVAGGTSGHFVGAALAFIVLGPWLGMLAMAAVVAVQALLFQDGGLLVMGANVLVMGVVPGFAALAVHHFGRALRGRARLFLAGVAAWFSVMMAALVTGLLLAFSGTSSLSVVVPAMLGIHFLIGIGEGLITAAALGFIQQTRPALLRADVKEAGGGRWVIAGLLIALFIVLLAPFASGHPDGLEWVAETTGFLHSALDAPYQILPDYTVPFLGDGALSTVVAGIGGSLLVAAIAYVIARSLRRA